MAERDYGLSTGQLQDLADSIPVGSAAAIMPVWIGMTFNEGISHNSNKEQTK